MGRHVWGDSPAMDGLVESVCAEIGAEISALGLKPLAGVVLGGGYGRGEGGVFTADGAAESLANDLDFYVVAVEGASAADLASIGEALGPISRKWTERLGIDVDFCAAKTPWRLKRDERRLMVQELVHGYFDVAGAKGETLFAGVRRLESSELPWTEAVRLLVNRGAGLLLAAESSEGKFIVRNINKCVLGAGDAKLISSGRYAWKAEDRAAALGDGLYSRALEWKFRPSAKGVCTWEDARALWLDTAREVLRKGDSSGLSGRSAYQAVRWIVRRRTIGEIGTLGQNPVVRILRRMIRCIASGEKEFRPGLRKDWMVFN